LLSAAEAAQQQKEERQQKMILSPAFTKWRAAYYACRICRRNADFICPRGLIPICSDCKDRYIGIFGYEAFEIMREEERKKKKRV
jgi:hypothetical protein